MEGRDVQVKTVGIFKRKKIRDLNIARIKRHWQLYLIILLPLLYIVIFCYIPMYGVTIAFKDFYSTKGILGSPWIGLKVFIRFFNSPSFSQIIGNTLSISLYSLIAGIPFPILLALALNETRNIGFKKTVQMVTYAPYFISTVIMVGILFELLDYRSGLLNSIAALFRIAPVNFMSKPALFKSIYVWSGIWQYMGFNAIIYIAALSAVDPTLYEAASIDGASRVQKIWNIDIPSIIPMFLTLLILNVGQIMNVGFEKVWLMQNSMNISVSEVISTYVYNVGLKSNEFSYGTAVGLFNSVINLVLIVTVNTISKKVGETSLW